MNKKTLFWLGAAIVVTALIVRQMRKKTKAAAFKAMQDTSSTEEKTEGQEEGHENACGCANA